MFRRYRESLPKWRQASLIESRVNEGPLEEEPPGLFRSLDFMGYKVVRVGKTLNSSFISLMRK